MRESRDSSLLISIATDNTVRLWNLLDIGDAKCCAVKMFIYSYSTSIKIGCDISPDNSLAAHGNVDGTVSVWGIRNKKYAAQYKVSSMRVVDLIFHPKKMAFFALTSDGN